MAYQIFFFDLDGTLIDSKISITTSVQYALSQYNITVKTDDLIPFIGPPLDESFQKYYGFDEKKSMQAVSYFREYRSRKGLETLTIFKGIPELLKKLKEDKKILYIVTSKSTQDARVIAEYVGLDEYFNAIIGCKLDLTNADKPSLVNKALALLGNKSKESIVMIGDKEHDVLGAQANGIDSIAVLYGYGSEKEIKKSKPTHIVKTIEDLGKLLTVDQV
jgi:phosphoglycolate phosphatase